MALKNWKKNKSGKYGEEWINNSTGDVIQIFYRPEIKFYHMLDERGRIIFEGEAKTKTEVINKAKKVMRLHD